MSEVVRVRLSEVPKKGRLNTAHGASFEAECVAISEPRNATQSDGVWATWRDIQTRRQRRRNRKLLEATKSGSKVSSDCSERERDLGCSSGMTHGVAPSLLSPALLNAVSSPPRKAFFFILFASLVLSLSTSYLEYFRSNLISGTALLLPTPIGRSTCVAFARPRHWPRFDQSAKSARERNGERVRPSKHEN